MCYMPAEIFNSAHERNVCYIDFFSADRGKGPCILSILQAWEGLHFNILRFKLTEHCTIVKSQENFFIMFWPLLKLLLQLF